jgi:hypothetical protein
VAALVAASMKVLEQGGEVSEASMTAGKGAGIPWWKALIINLIAGCVPWWKALIINLIAGCTLFPVYFPSAPQASPAVWGWLKPNPSASLDQPSHAIAAPPRKYSPAAMAPGKEAELAATWNQRKYIPLTVPCSLLQSLRSLSAKSQSPVAMSP